MVRDLFRVADKEFKRISKSFYYPTRKMPLDLRMDILSDYFMKRVADEIEDDLAKSGKKEKLLYDHISSMQTGIPDKAVKQFLSQNPKGTWQRDAVAKNYDLFFSVFGKIPKESRLVITETTLEMIPGMLREDFSEIESFKHLNEYCSYVAGIPGKSITRLFGLTGFLPEGTYNYMLKLSNEAGLGLQKANIIRDIARDMEEGRFYVPGELLEKHGLSRDNFVMTRANVEEVIADKTRSRYKVVNEMVVDASKSLESMVKYTHCIPIPNLVPAPKNKTGEELKREFNLSRGMRFFSGVAAIQTIKSLYRMHNSINPFMLGAFLEKRTIYEKKDALKTYFFMLRKWDSHKAIQEKFDSLSKFE